MESVTIMQGIKASVINRKEGVVDSILLQFSDIWGRQKVKQSLILGRESIPISGQIIGKSDWYVFRPGCGRVNQKVADTLENYMSVFQDMVMAQAEQDCTIQMGT